MTLVDQQNNAHFLCQETEVEIVKHLIPYLTHRSFLDIGAEKGSFTELLVSEGLKGALFEPLPKHEATLRELGQRTGCNFFPYAIDATDHDANFYIACDDDNNPLDYFHSLQKLDHDIRVQHKQSIPVICKSLNTLLHMGHVNKHIGIVKTDTEGNDLNVMKGMSEIQAEILICEFFMPGVYAGWEQGHPIGLIEEAKKLGFDHFVSIKRIQSFESVSLDNDHFVNGQWGNLIFMTEAIFNQATPFLGNMVGKKEAKLITDFVNQTNVLQNICDEREQLIQRLSRECEERLNIIHQLQKQLSPLTS